MHRLMPKHKASARLTTLMGSESEFRAHYRRPDAELMEKFRQRVFQCFDIDVKPHQVPSAGSFTLSQQARALKCSMLLTLPCTVLVIMQLCSVVVDVHWLQPVRLSLASQAQLPLTLDLPLQGWRPHFGSPRAASRR